MEVQALVVFFPPFFCSFSNALIQCIDIAGGVHKDRGVLEEVAVARPRQSQSRSELSSGQASYIIEKLLSERRISQSEVNRYIGDMQLEITELERRLQSLRAATGSSAASSSSSTGGGSAAPAARRRGRPPRPRSSGAEGDGSESADGKSEASPAPAKRGRRARGAITAEQLASRQLQGRYLGLIRQIPVTRRSQYQRIAKERGREAAVKEMSIALKK
jgi:hypothetical protein